MLARTTASVARHSQASPRARTAAVRVTAARCAAHIAYPGIVTEDIPAIDPIEHNPSAWPSGAATTACVMAAWPRPAVVRPQPALRGVE